MIVRSNVITQDDITRAVRETPEVEFIPTRKPQGVWFHPVRCFKPRRFEHGFEFFLTGSHTSASQHDRDYKAATWVEWGILIDWLFNLDPDAQIGWYKNRADFMQKTAEDYRIQHDEIKIEDCPWLTGALA